MKTFWIYLCFTLLFSSSFAFQNAQITDDGLEDQMDQLMTDYIKLLKSTFAEKDDSKSIVILKNGSSSLKSRFDKLKPELEKWIGSMTDNQQEQFKQRLMTKPYILDIFFLMNDENIASRIQKNAELGKALSELGNSLGSAQDLLK